jgi:hypothetical protein
MLATLNYASLTTAEPQGERRPQDVRLTGQQSKLALSLPRAGLQLQGGPATGSPLRMGML